MLHQINHQGRRLPIIYCAIVLLQKNSIIAGCGKSTVLLRQVCDDDKFDTRSLQWKGVFPAIARGISTQFPPHQLAPPNSA